MQVHDDLSSVRKVPPVAVAGQEILEFPLQSIRHHPFSRMHRLCAIQHSGLEYGDGTLRRLAPDSKVNLEIDLVAHYLVQLRCGRTTGVTSSR